MPENEKRATQHVFHFRQMRMGGGSKTRRKQAYFLSSARDRGAEYPKRAPMGVFEVFRLSRKGVGGAETRNATRCCVSHPRRVADGS